MKMVPPPKRYSQLSAPQARRLRRWLRRLDEHGTLWVRRPRDGRWGWEGRLVQRAQALGLVHVTVSKWDLFGGTGAREVEVTRR